MTKKLFVVPQLKLALFKFWCHFFFFHTPFFDCESVFRGDTQPIEKNLLDFQMQNFMLNLLNKNLFKNNHYSRCLQDPENSWCVLVKFEIFEQILGTKEDSQIKKRFEDSICFTFHLSTYYYMYPTCKNSTTTKKKNACLQSCCWWTLLEISSYIPPLSEMTLHYHGVYQISSLEDNLSLKDLKHLYRQTQPRTMITKQ